ncbi:MAG: GH1 family beta-glucosidase [Steroidobacteraceae bacterium]
MCQRDQTVSANGRFPRGFLWGAATSAYQIEGSPLADGAGPSIWQRFVHTPGRVRNGDTGDIACDHYHRFRDDITLMHDLGLRAYRFSISWSRVLPAGRGRVNAAGLGFYDRLVDALLEKNIEPVATLYHWDLPAALDDLGGWLNPEIAHWFADFGATMFRALDGRVKKWATLNEPRVVADGGYLHGRFPPEHRNRFEAPIATHNLLRAHGSAVRTYRQTGKHEIGLVVDIEPKYPASTSTEDRAATARADAYMNRQYLDPVFLGRYPAELKHMFGDAWPEWPAEDFELIRQPIDFLGVNYYTRAVTAADPKEWPVHASTVMQPQARYTESGWEVFPRGLTDTIASIRKHYGRVPVYITENGAAFADPASTSDELLDDPLRVTYLQQHIEAVRDAIAEGADIRGYFVWSLLDNFEWTHGFSVRFGIVHVDYATQRRTPKASANFYAGVVATNGDSLAQPSKP